MKLREPWSLRQLAAWYATSVCIFLLLPTWKFGLPLWRLQHSDLLPFACLATAFVVSAGIAVLLRPADRWRALWLTAAFTIANFGVVFFGFIVTRTEFSRATTIAAFSYAMALIPAPYVVGASRMYRAMAFVALLAAGVAVPFLAWSRPAPQLAVALIKTEYYNLNVSDLFRAFPRSVIVGGGLARIGNSYLRLSGNGHLYAFGWEAETDHLTVTPLPYRVPINGDEFAAAAGRPWEISSGEGTAQENQKIESD